MKVMNTVLKILAVLAMIAGVIYVIAAYGDKIAAWARKLLNRLSSCRCCDEDTLEEVEEASAEEEAVQAEEQDFEG